MLGAADDADAVLTTAVLPTAARVVNYYSPKADTVLHDAYFNALGHRAAGSVGFRSGPFLNYRCSATHARKPGLMHCDWSQMAPAIVEFAAFAIGVHVDGALNTNWALPVGKGDQWWNNVMELRGFSWKGDRVDVNVQQNGFDGHYRLAVAGQGSERLRREGWSARLSPLLRHLGLTLEHRDWPLHGYPLGLAGGSACD